MKLLTKEEWEILNCIEEFHLRAGKFPALSTIAKRTGIDQVLIVESLSNPLLQRSLEARGINFNLVDDERLKPVQLAAIQLLLNVTDTRNIKEKLASLGVKSATYQGWKKQPYFMAAYREASENLYGESLPEVHRSLVSNAIEGDLSSQKLVLAISGRWDTSKSVEGMNVQFVLMKVLEVIQKHVKDKDALEAIAGEFEGLLNPQPKAKLEVTHGNYH